MMLEVHKPVDFIVLNGPARRVRSNTRTGHHVWVYVLRHGAWVSVKPVESQVELEHWQSLALDADQQHPYTNGVRFHPGGHPTQQTARAQPRARHDYLTFQIAQAMQDIVDAAGG